MSPHKHAKFEAISATHLAAFNEANYAADKDTIRTTLGPTHKATCVNAKFTAHGCTKCAAYQAAINSTDK